MKKQELKIKSEPENTVVTRIQIDKVSNQMIGGDLVSNATKRTAVRQLYVLCSLLVFRLFGPQAVLSAFIQHFWLLALVNLTALFVFCCNSSASLNQWPVK